MFELVINWLSPSDKAIDVIVKLFPQGIIETLMMTFISGAGGIAIGLPIGILLFCLRPNGILANPTLYKSLSLVVNYFRAIPFFIMIVWLLEVTKFIVGKKYGIWAAIIPLTVACSPFIARMTENVLLELPNGLIEASRAMGASPSQIIFKVLVPEALPGLINSFTVVFISLVGYSAMGGAVGAGGLGQIAHKYGYVGYDAFIMNCVVLLFVIIVTLIQLSGTYLSKKVNKR
ncbi:methionine ABC transporter permease [Thorsellia anophelis]|uniref:D-methionine transport system permease protein MetI n=1 Tax=Thorsellia anophelis DSM 18579 TaxID=1123402 RepID=A0A1I0EV06_9GAMM|nr:methionine ABC transporter permease MetI [Thorsellia anophelis]SET49411.1 D-methionine transport system permease protein [Thorsellia anophelis DSM 18579]